VTSNSNVNMACARGTIEAPKALSGVKSGEADYGGPGSVMSSPSGSGAKPPLTTHFWHTFGS